MKRLFLDEMETYGMLQVFLTNVAFRQFEYARKFGGAAMLGVKLLLSTVNKLLLAYTMSLTLLIIYERSSNSKSRMNSKTSIVSKNETRDVASIFKQTS